MQSSKDEATLENFSRACLENELLGWMEWDFELGLDRIPFFKPSMSILFIASMAGCPDAEADLCEIFVLS